MSNRPNIVIIMVDQQRYDCIGYSGMMPVATPHLDRFASQGMWFSRAYSHIPVCGPARQSFANGRRPESFGALWNFSLALKVQALEPSAYSWARSLQELGYRNGYVGKWDVNPEHDPTVYGYDEYANSDALYRQFLQERYPQIVYDGSYFGEVDPLPLEDTRTHRTARIATEMIHKLAESGAPFHLRVNFGEPHLPCRPAAPFAERYRPEDVPEWGSFAETFDGKPYIQEQQLYNWRIEGFTWRDWAPVVARYYAVISQLDDSIGQVLRKLDELGLTGDTLVVYTSDHGDMCGGHRMMDKHYVMYEDVVRVPLAIRWPGVVPPGSRSDRFVYNLLDLPPTILDLTDSPVPEQTEFHGRSLMPLLTGSASAEWRSEIAATYNGQQFGLFTQRMIRTEDWKYVWNPTDVDELYDMKADPHELRNVARHPAYADPLRMLRKRLYEILLQDGDGMVKTVWMRDQLLEGRKK